MASTISFGPLSVLALTALFELSHAQSIAPCVSTPGVNLELLSACEGLRSQAQTQLTAGGTVALATQITYQVTSSNALSSGAAFSLASTTSVARTSAVATSENGGGLGGAGTNSPAQTTGASSASAGIGGIGGSGSSTTDNGINGGQ